jgi:hypothetical protein
MIFSKGKYSTIGNFAIGEQAIVIARLGSCVHTVNYGARDLVPSCIPATCSPPPLSIMGTLSSREESYYDIFIILQRM